MNLTHYRKEPMTEEKLEEIFATASRQDRKLFKPVGFWVSVDGPDDWKAWCEAEGFHLECLVSAHRVTLADDANILHLKSPRDIDRFDAAYGLEISPITSRTLSCNWPKVAEKYDGIIIAPYQWSRRFSTGWYYGWDCSSGCIWQRRAINSIQLIADARTRAA